MTELTLNLSKYVVPPPLLSSESVPPPVTIFFSTSVQRSVAQWVVTLGLNVVYPKDRAMSDLYVLIVLASYGAFKKKYGPSRQKLKFPSYRLFLFFWISGKTNGYRMYTLHYNLVEN